MNNRCINSKSSHEEAADVEAASCLVIPCHYLPRFPPSVQFWTHLFLPLPLSSSLPSFATCGEKGMPKIGQTPLTS